MAKERVDVLAYKQGLFETREQAKRGVMAGLVVAVMNGQRYDKPGEKIDEVTELKLKGERLKYVSRGGLKLEKALSAFGLSVFDQIGLDIGASTGGFTDVMLQAGAKSVYAVDVGTNQLAWKLRQDPRVLSMEQYNFRYASLADFTHGQPTVASIDVSFISLALILPALHEILADDGQVVALIKPQFEAGREFIGKNGIVKDQAVHERVIREVVDRSVQLGFSVLNLDFSPIQGGQGNIEFLAHLEKSPAPQSLVLEKIVRVVQNAHDTFKRESSDH
ncbi:TlyA family RNA methyltransferase [Streptococcus entericus]|uniref:TlyA family RNA methyltransferase n=1 Tax=Streptococcus entericus TaxID=155680 RepID=UPI000364DF10|nr:TlyA family RNA methyltransferase [Streptococcus entericus]